MHRFVSPLTGWKSWVEQIMHPQVPEEQWRQELQALRLRLPPPVIWLLGKTQSGKSSITHVLTGSPKAEIGNGFKPCTRTAMLYDFPEPETAFIRFLDTRGLSEAGYDPAEDMQWCERQAQLLIVVMKAMDHQQQGVIDAAEQIHEAHPGWPIIVAQTALHEGYPDRAMEHIQPYPFGDANRMADIPPDLRVSLLKQRESLKNIGAEFVALDFTMPEEGYQISDYGVDALWTAIETALPRGLRALLDQQAEKTSTLHTMYRQAAHPSIVAYALSAGLAAAIPVPAAGMASVLAIQAKLLHSVAQVYGLSLTKQTLSEIASALGLGLLAGMGGRELLKLVPFYGQTGALGISALYSAAVTYALGKTLCFYFDRTRRGMALTDEALRQVFKAEFEKGRDILRAQLGKEKR